MRSIIVSAALLIAGTASAQDTTTFDNDRFGPDLVTEAGTAITAGGGVTIQDEEAGGMWQVRGIYGTRSIVGAEAAYVGTARDLPNTDNTALTNGGEVALRLQLPMGMDRPTVVAPFAYGGVGYEWAEIAQEGNNPRDSQAYIPVGVGLGVASEGIYGDARLSWQAPLGDDDLVGNADEGTLIISGNIGAEF